MKTKIIKLIVRANSSKNSIDGIYLDRIKVRVASPPEKGKANKELIRFISEKLEMPRKNIKIIAGEKSSLKALEVEDSGKNDLISKLLDS